VKEFYLLVRRAARLYNHHSVRVLPFPSGVIMWSGNSACRPNGERNSWDRGRLVGVLLLLLGLPASVIPLAGRESSTEEVKAAFKSLNNRMSGVTIDQPKLRRDLLDFRVRYPGTDEAVRAAELISRLPSPLDKLDRSKIPELERFSQQPKELVAVLGEHRGRHGAAVSCVAVSPDSSLVASGGSYWVRLWDANTMRLKAILPGGVAAITSVTFSKDGKTLAAGSAYGPVYVWDIAKPEEPTLRFAIPAATSAVYSVAFHPSGKSLAAGCFDNTFRVYDVSGKKFETLAEVAGHEKAIQAVAYSLDGKQLATGGAEGVVQLWNAQGNEFKEQARLEGGAGAVSCLTFTSSGKTLATGSADGGLRLWNYPCGPKQAPRLTVPVSKTGVTGLSFSTGGNTVAVTVGDNDVHLWTLAGKVRELSRLDGHAGVATSVAYAPDMRILVSGGADWTVRTWDLRKPKSPERFTPWSHLSFVYSVAFAPDGATLASGSEDRVVRFWDLTRAEPRTRNFLKGESVPVYAVAYSADGKLVAAGGLHTTVRQWDANTGTTRPSCLGNEAHVNGLIYAPDGKHLYSVSGKQVLMFDAVKGGEVRRFSPHDTAVTALALSPDGRRAATGSGYYLYDKDNKIVIEKGKYVYKDCLVRLWNTEKGDLIHSIKDFTMPIAGLCFSGDGRDILAGTYDPGVRRWSRRGDMLAERDPVKTETAMNYGLLPTPDGKYLFSRSTGGGIYQWDLTTGKQVRQWTLHEQAGSLALSADGRHLAVGLGTGVVYILRLAPPGGSIGSPAP
jgi:WD40 repeat protein